MELNVVIKLGTPNLIVMKPLKNPKSIVMTNPMNKDRMVDTPWFKRTAKIHAGRDRTAPAAISISPTVCTKVTPKDNTVTKTMEMIMAFKFALVKKLGIMREHRIEITITDA
jgi:hypothetical protein